MPAVVGVSDAQEGRLTLLKRADVAAERVVLRVELGEPPPTM